MQTLDEALDKLQASKFRASFHLTAKDKAYVKDKGMDTIRLHAEDFIRSRLAPEVIPNDGKQTPMRGHPVFVAQHATACCCRGCLYKWYKVKPGKALNDVQISKIVGLIMAWIEREMQNSECRVQN